MTHVHVCTNKSFRAGVDLPPISCPLCAQETCFFDYVGMSCDTCGGVFDDERGLALSIARFRKKHFKRKEWAKLIGCQPSTVSTYDWRPSNPYIEKSKAIIQKLYANQMTTPDNSGTRRAV